MSAEIAPMQTENYFTYISELMLGYLLHRLLTTCGLGHNCSIDFLPNELKHLRAVVKSAFAW